MQVRGKTRWCFSVILAFSKSLHESCRLFAFYRRAAHFFFLQAVYLGLTLCAVKLYVNLQSLSSTRWDAAFKAGMLLSVASPTIAWGGGA